MMYLCLLTFCLLGIFHLVMQSFKSSIGFFLVAGWIWWSIIHIEKATKSGRLPTIKIKGKEFPKINEQDMTDEFKRSLDKQ